MTDILTVKAEQEEPDSDHGGKLLDISRVQIDTRKRNDEIGNSLAEMLQQQLLRDDPEHLIDKRNYDGLHICREVDTDIIKKACYDKLIKIGTDCYANLQLGFNFQIETRGITIKVWDEARLQREVHRQHFIHIFLSHFDEAIEESKGRILHDQHMGQYITASRKEILEVVHNYEFKIENTLTYYKMQHNLAIMLGSDGFTIFMQPLVEEEKPIKRSAPKRRQLKAKRLKAIRALLDDVSMGCDEEGSLDDTFYQVEPWRVIEGFQQHLRADQDAWVDDENFFEVHIEETGFRIIYQLIT